MANLGSIFRLLIWDPFNRIFYSFHKNSFKRNQFQFFSPCFHSSIQFAFLSLAIIFSAIVFFIFTSCHRHHRLLLRPLLHLSSSSSSSAIIFIIFVFILSYHLHLPLHPQLSSSYSSSSSSSPSFIISYILSNIFRQTNNNIQVSSISSRIVVTFTLFSEQNHCVMTLHFISESISSILLFFKRFFFSFRSKSHQCLRGNFCFKK